MKMKAFSDEVTDEEAVSHTTTATSSGLSNVQMCLSVTATTTQRRRLLTDDYEKNNTTTKILGFDFSKNWTFF